MTRVRWAPIVVALGLSACAASNEDGMDDASAESDDDGGSSGPPNIIFVFVDDMGYADLGVYGAQAIETPNLDRLAAQGVRFTQFYSGNGVCTPSRAVLLTGRAGRRQILEETFGGVYWPDARGGMSPDQITLAEVLAGAGYRTALVGKWHLGDAAEYLPTRQGFDHFWGLPYSNDMVPLPLMDQEETIDTLTLADQANLTGRYTEEIVEVMRESAAADEPFFVYYANNFPHTPLAASPQFSGRSPTCEEAGLEEACGLYADVVAELDASVGTLMDELDALGIADDTIIAFTSDNGPWLDQGRDDGSAGPLREGKGTTFEGGFRVPMIVRGPGVSGEGRVIDEPAVMYDWLPTLAAAAGVSLPDRTYDGFDLGPLLGATGARDPGGDEFRFVYHRLDNETAGAYRRGRWKYKAAVETGEAPYALYEHDEMLFDLDADPSESEDLAAMYPDLVAELAGEMQERDATLEADPDR